MSNDQTDPKEQIILATFWEKAKQAAAQGQHEQARAWIEGIVELDGKNVDAWLRLAQLVPDARERMLCYSRVLELAPGNPQAKAGLRRTRREM